MSIGSRTGAGETMYKCENRAGHFWTVGQIGRLFLFALLALAMCLPVSCAAPAKPGVFVWPGSAQQPRIAYLESHSGQSDYAKANVLDTLAGAKTLCYDLVKPYGVTARDGKIYVADSQVGVVFAIDTIMKKVTFIGSAAQGRLALPLGVAVASDGRVFVSDAKLKRIYCYSPDGVLLMAIGQAGELLNPAGLAISDRLGRLYAVDSHGHNIRVYDTASGKLLFTIGKRGAGDGEFNFPTNAAIDNRNGNLYVVDTQNFRVEAFDKDGKFIRKFGRLGDRPGMFARPKGIGIDSEGHVYVSDAAFNNFQVFDDKGQLLLFLGSAGSNPGMFTMPSGMFVDSQDRIYAVDVYNRRVQVFQYLSDAWRQAHPDKYKEYITWKPEPAKAKPDANKEKAGR